MTRDQLTAIAAWFAEFTAGFLAEVTADQRNYALKIEHTQRVRENSEQLAAALEMPAAEQTLAAAIALCHDVGRFPQFRDYGTFNDAIAANHATLAVVTLRHAGILDILDAAERRLLLQTVARHNAFTLPQRLDPQRDRHLRLIRDADKLDIWRVLIDYRQTPPAERPSAVLWGLPQTGRCSAAALEAVARGELLHRDLVRTADDFTLLQLSWVFDLNFAASFALLAERGYLETLIGLLPEQPGSLAVVAAVRDSVRRRTTNAVSR